MKRTERMTPEERRLRRVEMWHDPEMSVEKIAAKVGMNAAYVRRLINEHLDVIPR